MSEARSWGRVPKVVFYEFIHYGMLVLKETKSIVRSYTTEKREHDRLICLACSGLAAVQERKSLCIR